MVWCITGRSAAAHRVTRRCIVARQRIFRDRIHARWNHTHAAADIGIITRAAAMNATFHNLSPDRATASSDEVALLRLDAITVGYPAGGAAGGQRRVVEALSLRLDSGEIGCLLGASGCGKTTVLRAIAGFEPLLAGRISLQGRGIANAGGHGLPPEQRRVGMMFQDYALFPHLDAAANVGFGLRALTKPARTSRVAEMLSLVGLADRARAYPHQLSGGQQQRIALARALAPSPALLMLDEPFSNLDGDIRGRLAEETRILLKATGATALMVTHDQIEAFTMADRVGVMAEGRILQWDTPAGLYLRPVDRRVAGFIGRGDWVRSETLGLGVGADVRVRPGQLVLDPEGPLSAMLESSSFRGPHCAGRLRFDSGDIIEIAVDAAVAATVQIGQRLRLRVIGDDMHDGGWLRFSR
jgi:iron(III) transport system ATP-binding protein